MRAGFDLRQLGTERGTFNERRGMFIFNGQMSGYAPADFMLGIPRQVNTPADRVINDIVGWRNGFFVNDTWQPNRNPTLNLGLRYELQLVPYTVNGNASMLNANRRRSSRQTPTPGFKFHDAESQGLRAAARRGVPRDREDRRAGGVRDLLQPEPLQQFHLADQQPAIHERVRVHPAAGQPHAVAEEPVGAGRTGREAEHHHAEPASAERAQGPVEPRPAAGALGTRRARRAVSRFAHEQPGQELLQQHAVAGTRRDSRAASQPVVRRDPRCSRTT